MGINIEILRKLFGLESMTLAPRMFKTDAKKDLVTYYFGIGIKAQRKEDVHDDHDLLQRHPWAAKTPESESAINDEGSIAAKAQ